MKPAPGILFKIKEDIAQKINRVLKVEAIQPRDIAYPPNSEMGDLSLACFNHKTFGSDLGALAKAVAKLDIVASVNWAGRFMNISLDRQQLIKSLIAEIGRAGREYGRNRSGRSERVMVEFTNVNTHKQYHVGHVRNLCYGDSLAKILGANGYKVFPVSYVNDFGSHTAKTLWALREFYQDREIPENKGAFLGEVYVRASRELKENQIGARLVEGIMKRIEARQGEDYAKWQETREWTISQLAAIYEKMGVELEHIFYEHEFIDQGRAIVNELIKKGILKESEGAIIADLTAYGLGVQVVLRSDGTATYIVADLSLALEKFGKYKLDRSIYITDNRQALHFKQFFKLLELMGHKQKLVHLTHDFVKLPGGMIASRTGNVITFEELYEALSEKTRSEAANRHGDWDGERIEKAAGILALATIKFEMNKVKADQVITFDLEKALSFQGYTAAYLLYTFARIKSIFKKASRTSPPKEFKPDKLKETAEYRLALKLAKYPEMLARAGAEYDPSAIAKYLFELAQDFNDYYHNSSVIKADEDVKTARLALLGALAQVLENGLALLGIKPAEEM